MHPYLEGLSHARCKKCHFMKTVKSTIQGKRSRSLLKYAMLLREKGNARRGEPPLCASRAQAAATGGAAGLRGRHLLSNCLCGFSCMFEQRGGNSPWLLQTRGSRILGSELSVYYL